MGGVEDDRRRDVTVAPFHPQFRMVRTVATRGRRSDMIRSGMSCSIDSRSRLSVKSVLLQTRVPVSVSNL